MDKFHLKRRFEALLKKDFTSSSIGDVEREIEKHLGSILRIGNNYSNKFALYRSRQINSEVEDITLLSTFSSPPSKETRLGRANMIGYPVVYASEQGSVALSEINAKIGETYYLSIWEKKEGTPLYIEFFLANMTKDNKLYETYNNINNQLVHELNLSHNEYNKKYRKALKYYSKLFINKNYHLTSKIAHSVIYHPTRNTNGIVYPSIKWPDYCNFAFNPDYFNDSFQLKYVVKTLYSGGPIESVQQLLELGEINKKSNKIVWGADDALKKLSDYLRYNYKQKK